MTQIESGKKIIANGGGGTPLAEYPSATWPKGNVLQENSPKPFSNMPNLNDGLKSMKKGFTSLMTSIDSALKPSPDDASDTISIRSDISSDSEKYVFVNLGADGDRYAEAMFRVPEFQSENKG